MARRLAFSDRTAKRDQRTVTEVEETRCTCNFKFGRDKRQKEKARSEAFIPKSGKYKGTHISYAARNQKFECTCGAKERRSEYAYKHGISIPG